MIISKPHFDVEVSRAEVSGPFGSEPAYLGRLTTFDTIDLLSKIQRLAKSLRRAWDKRLRKSIPNMNAARSAVIVQLGRSGGASQIRLARLLGMSQMTVSRTLDSLERLNWIQREPVPGDRRAWAVRLTQKGREALLAVHSARRAFLEQSVSAIGIEHGAALAATLARLEAAQAGAPDV